MGKEKMKAKIKRGKMSKMSSRSLELRSFLFGDLGGGRYFCEYSRDYEEEEEEEEEEVVNIKV